MTAGGWIELHLHLEGAAPPGFIRGLADEKGHDLQGIFAVDGSYRYGDFSEFLKVYETATSVLQSPQDYYRLTREVLEIQAAQGVIYTEAFLSPTFCGGGDLVAWRDYVAAISDAAAEAEAEDGVVMRGVVTAIRHLGPDAAKAASLCAAETSGAFIVGFGMAGQETAGKKRDFAYAFDMAREAKLGLTVHAGEWHGPASVKDALDDLRISRIGHGVRAIEDPVLVERLAEAGTVLEVCPGSNIALGLYPDWPSHPIADLRAAGVAVTVSTDDPPFFHTNMGHEFDMLNQAFGWDVADFDALTQTALDAAFCDDDTRARVKKLLEPEDV